MIKNLSLCIFDWDGTVVDSLANIVDCKRRIAQEYNQPIPSSDLVRSVIGMPIAEAFRRCFKLADAKELELIIKRFHELMKLPEYQAFPFPGAIDTLKYLKEEKRLKLAIATSKAFDEMESAITHLRIKGLFDTCCSGELFAEKPDPLMIRHIVELLDTDLDSTVMIGDTIMDIEFSKNAGVEFIAVSFGAQSLEQLQAYSKTPIIDSWGELPNVLERLYCV